MGTLHRLSLLHGVDRPGSRHLVSVAAGKCRPLSAADHDPRDTRKPATTGLLRTFGFRDADAARISRRRYSRELCRAEGFTLAPCRPRTPQSSRRTDLAHSTLSGGAHRRFISGPGI